MTSCASRKRSSVALDDGQDACSDASSLLSSLSRSPTPPSELLYKAYPSPFPSQQSSLEGSPSPDGVAAAVGVRNGDGAPAAKKRRLHEPRPRTTEKLTLLADDVDTRQKDQLNRLLKVLHKRRKIVVIAGAGISVSAGIPDFRSSTGLFRSLKGQHKLKSSGKDLFDASVYKDDKSTTQFHDMVRTLAKMVQSATPTPFHHLLATLAQEDRLLRLYSQNVDGIDTQLPPLATQVPLNRKGPWPKTIQLHGNLEKMVCSKCRNMTDLNPELFDGPTPPLCQHCVDTDDVRTKHAGKRSHGVGCLRPRMVLYNEHNPDDEAIGSVVKADLQKRPDALIVVGTSLKVPGVRRIVKEMCGVVRSRRDGLTIWINNDPPPLVKDFEWDLVVQGPCDEVANRACMRKWDEPDVLEFATEEQVQKLVQTWRPEVVIESPRKTKTFETVQGVVTPAASPRIPPLVLVQKQGGTKATAEASLTGLQAKGGKKSATAKAPKVPRAPKAPKAKGPAASKKTAAAKVPRIRLKINQSFTVSKPAAQAASSKAKQAAGYAGIFVEPKTPANFNSSLVSTPMKPVSPSAARNNSSPPFAPPSGKLQGGSELEIAKTRHLTLDTTAVRRESPEERRRTISPTGPLPNGMANLLHLG